MKAEGAKAMNRILFILGLGLVLGVNLEVATAVTLFSRGDYECKKGELYNSIILIEEDHERKLRVLDNIGRDFRHPLDSVRQIRFDNLPCPSNEPGVQFANGDWLTEVTIEQLDSTGNASFRTPYGIYRLNPGFETIIKSINLESNQGGDRKEELSEDVMPLFILTTGERLSGIVNHVDERDEERTFTIMPDQDSISRYYVPKNKIAKVIFSSGFLRPAATRQATRESSVILRNGSTLSGELSIRRGIWEINTPYGTFELKQGLDALSCWNRTSQGKSVIVLSTYYKPAPIDLAANTECFARVTGSLALTMDKNIYRVKENEKVEIFEETRINQTKTILNYLGELGLQRQIEVPSLTTGKHTLILRRKSYPSRSFSVMIYPQVKQTIVISKPEKLQEEIERKDGSKMRLFEKGQHRYYIDQNEVAMKQYRIFRNTRHFSFESVTTSSDTPVHSVSWYQALDYCMHLGKRLPSAEEWDFAMNAKRMKVIDTKTKNRLGVSLGNIQAGITKTRGDLYEWVDDSDSEGTSKVFRPKRDDGDDTRYPDTMNEKLGFRCAMSSW